MSGSTPNLIEIVVLAASADTLLDGRGSVVRRLFYALKVRLKGHHSRVGEQQSVIVGDDARGRGRLMSALGEEVGECTANLLSVHAGEFIGPMLLAAAWIAAFPASPPRLGSVRQGALDLSVCRGPEVARAFA